MKRITRGVLIASLVMMLHVPLSWGGPPNPTGSDANRNTAGGGEALNIVTTGTNNTAFGFAALAVSNQSYNTAIGVRALVLNRGDYNTAIGFHALSNGTDDELF